MKKTQKRKRKSSGFSSFVKILFILILMALVTAATFTGSYVLSVIKRAPKIDPENYRTVINETSRVYDDKEQLIQTLVLNEFSEYVNIDKIPINLQKAVLAIEDERFYSHGAVDFKRVIGATVANLKAHKIVQGGSTITMQLAKNLYTDYQKSFERKLTDIFYAYELESVLTKDQILEAYLNSAGFSKGTVGVQAAAKTFFNKDVSELNLAECALVAGITNRPEKYSPYNRIDVTLEDDLENLEIVLIPTPKDTINSEETIQIGKRLAELGKIDSFDLNQIERSIMRPMKAIFNPVSKERQELILKLMLKQGYIDQAQHDEAINAPINIDIGNREEKGVSSFYVDEVKKETVSILKSLGYSEEDANKKLYAGGLKIYSSMNLDLQKSMEETVSNNSYFPNAWIDDNGIPQPQVAAVLTDPHTGQVKALIGGRNISGGSNLNRATTPRSPGSSIKPISVYMTAFKYGATAGDVYLDETLPSSQFKGWRPRNNGNSYIGWTTIRTLLKRSSNVGAYLVARDIGCDYESNANKNSVYSKAVNEPKAVELIKENLESIGVTSLVWPKNFGNTKTTDENLPDENKDAPVMPDDANFSALALGGMTHGISPLEMAGAYSTLANEGVYQKPTFVDKILSTNGEIIYENKHEGEQVLSEGNAFIITNILEDVVKSGTGTSANFSRMHIAGKTGTTNQQKEVWFVGYTPYYLCSVFIGNDRHESLHFSSNVAAALWRGIMKPIHADLENKEFVQPDNVIRKYVPGADRSEYFVENTKPHYTNKLFWYEEDEDEDNDNNTNSDDNGKKSKSTKKKKSSKSTNSNYRTENLKN
ncbi:transglycosylase domain-containing protein, partial [Peptoniphilus sp. oral taxon 386]|uniref:transglycosylase domain-containing protein n=1 Tax=Peptoniphilus sp. oral taxon 386 TaxID=652713 RepID=UPI000680F8B4